MVNPVLHIPLDFERREDVRKLAHRLQNSDLAILYVFRMWMDWAVNGSEWRGFNDLYPDTFDEEKKFIEWLDRQELTHIIEDFCGYAGDKGRLICESVGAGVLTVSERDGVGGLVLNDFWRFNNHLSPGHKSMQQRGAIAKHARRSAVDIQQAASQQVDIITDGGRQFALPLDSKPTTEEVKRCVSLIMMIDRACGRNPRKPQEYTKNETLMTNALQVVRRFSMDDVGRVYEYVIANRDNPRLGKIPDRIIEKFGEHLEKANGVLVTA